MSIKITLDVMVGCAPPGNRNLRHMITDFGPLVNKHPLVLDPQVLRFTVQPFMVFYAKFGHNMYIFYP